VLGHCGLVHVRANRANRAAVADDHDAPAGVVPQQYPPDDLVGRDYYRPTDHGFEAQVRERLARLRRIVRGR
jgi:putative ATPase